VTVPSNCSQWVFNFFLFLSNTSSCSVSFSSVCSNSAFSFENVSIWFWRFLNDQTYSANHLEALEDRSTWLDAARMATAPIRVGIAAMVLTEKSMREIRPAPTRPTIERLPRGSFMTHSLKLSNAPILSTQTTTYLRKRT